MKSKQTGFSTFELIFTLIIVMAVVGTITDVAVNSSTLSEQMQRGGTLCKGGVLFNVDSNGNQHQIFGPNGGGVTCQ